MAWLFLLLICANSYISWCANINMMKVARNIHTHSLESCAACREKSTFNIHSQFFSLALFFLQAFRNSETMPSDCCFFSLSRKTNAFARTCWRFYFQSFNFFSVGLDEMKTHHVHFAWKLYGHVFHICHLSSTQCYGQYTTKHQIFTRSLSLPRSYIHYTYTYTINLNYVRMKPIQVNLLSMFWHTFMYHHCVFDWIIAKSFFLFKCSSRKGVDTHTHIQIRKILLYSYLTYIIKSNDKTNWYEFLQ